MRRMFEGIIKNRLFDLLLNPVGMGASGPWQMTQKARGLIGREVAADLVEPLAGIAHYPSGTVHMAQFTGQF